ncbi:MAG: MFS transporter, partial [Clostridia bacterium]|nr:MFS transporter [Clostridia bacterium]
PTVEAFPSENKATSMTMIHAFYPLGQVLTVVLTTAAIAVFGDGSWWWIFVAWAIVPVVNLLRSLRAPFPPILKSGERAPVLTLLKTPQFWLMLVMMVCAGASEQTMGQWASLFAEKALGVDKLFGDLLGPCLFAACMLIGRFWYGKYGDGMSLPPLLIGCSLASVVCYTLAVFAAFPLLALIGCALCGLSVSLMWPGTLSEAAAKFPTGGTALFGLLALGGDLGCSLGPWIAGAVADLTPYGIKAGLMVAMVFPFMMFLFLILHRNAKAAEE